MITAIFWSAFATVTLLIGMAMASTAVLLTLILGWVDERIPNEMLNDSKVIISGSASDLRVTMIGVASTILATAGVVFSLLTLPLSTVASQFGSRLLRIFLRDRTTQLVLGMFVGTFCYCLATALSIPYEQTQVDAPQITVTFGLFLMLATFASLIILNQHISTMLQAPNIAAAAGAELMEVVGVATLDEAGENPNPAMFHMDETIPLDEKDAYSVRVNKRGYIQFVDPNIILNLAREKDLVIRMLRKPGQFVSLGETTALV